jgi:FkbM family methyltransferase
LKTSSKIALARLAYQSIKLGRRLFGLRDYCQVTRGGLRYELDLSQGIDFAIFLLGSFEPNTVAALRRNIKPGATVLDIGSNIGAHTLNMACFVGSEGRVLSFEPTDFAFKKQRRNLELNPEIKDRVRMLQYFLTAESKAPLPPTIYSSWPLLQTDAVHKKHRGQAMETTGARTATLDEVLSAERIDKVDLVKLDVDGFECDVLGGATTMIERDRPIFVMELSPYVLIERGTTLDRFLNFFVPLGYCFYDERTDLPLPKCAIALERMIGDGASKNVVARINWTEGAKD